MSNLRDTALRYVREGADDYHLTDTEFLRCEGIQFTVQVPCDPREIVRLLDTVERLTKENQALRDQIRRRERQRQELEDYLEREMPV